MSTQLLEKFFLSVKSGVGVPRPSTPFKLYRKVSKNNISGFKALKIDKKFWSSLHIQIKVIKVFFAI